MKGFAILSVVLLLFIHDILSAIVDERAYVVYDSTSDNWSVIKGEPKKKGSDAVAWAKYTASMNETGWDIFEVTTNSSFTDALAAYGAGYLEGYLTYVSTWNAWKSFCNGTYWNYTNEFKTFVTGNDKWYRNQVSDPTENTDYWSQVGLVLQQFDGFLAGYNAKAPQSNQLTYLDFLTYTLQFEMWDIYTAAAQEDQLSSNHNMENHCSVLVKVTDDGKRLFAAHDTWSTYNTMLRTYKHYNLHFNAPSTQANTISFSSYPGMMVSGDDFYVTSQNMAVMETTNSVFNKTLYQHTTIETVPYWIRVSVANRMAASGQTWSQTFSLYNSGTYNNQWIIVDYKQFTSGQPLQDNTLWILEQVPGYVVSSDMTKTLESSRYWASYNIPYYPFIYNISGYMENFEKSGNSFSWSECARAQIFRRDESVVETLGDMKSIMRYNEYQVDPLSLGDACRGISARCDLNTPWALNTLNGYSAFGAIDSKVTDNTISVKNEAHAISGPSWESQPPFAWTKQFQYQPHFGQPIVFDFHYHSMKPEKK